VLAGQVGTLEEARARVRASFARDTGLEGVEEKLPLQDPITYERLSCPVRGRECRHLACFDLHRYLSLNRQLPRWRCPLCRRPAPPSFLLVDPVPTGCLASLPPSVVFLSDAGGMQYMADILANVPGSCEEVIVHADASWTPVPAAQKPHDSDSEEEDVEIPYARPVGKSTAPSFVFVMP
jgi:hypothetical protein